MSYSRRDELTKARSILSSLGLKSTSAIVAAMEHKVGRRETIGWSEMQTFLDSFDNESNRHGETCRRTFEIMEKIIMQALEDGGTASKRELKNRGLNAPKIDQHTDALEYGLSILHNEVQQTNRTRTGVLLLMFGHVVRWQVLRDFAKVWVGHWGKGIRDSKLKKNSVELLLTIKFTSQASGVTMADTRLYRNAIAHGGFKFEDDHRVSFWTRDSRGKKHQLPILNSGDLLGLYKMTEIRLRTMEALARVLRAWGRHGIV